MARTAGKSSAATWVVVLILGAGGLGFAFFQGIAFYMTSTAPVLHPVTRDVPSVAGSEPKPDLAQSLEKARNLVRETLHAENLPGLSVAVGVGDRIVWSEGFGYADLENRVSVTPAHRFRIGTASVVLTSAAAGLLLEEERLKLEDVIQAYVPEYPDKGSPVTLGQLMAHTAGLRHGAGDEGPLYGLRCGSAAEAAKHFAGWSLLFEPGAGYRFSSLGWILVSAAVEDASGKPFLEFMHDRVFRPLGMRDTVPDSLTKPIPNRATFYFPRFSADPSYGLHLMRDVEYSCYAGASVFLSTPSDLVRFGLAINGGKLLRPSTVRLLQTSQRLPTGQETGYGLGWDLESASLGGKPARLVGHDGDIFDGQVGTLATFPEHGLAVAVLSNISFAGTHQLAVKLAAVFADQPKAAPDAR